MPEHNTKVNELIVASLMRVQQLLQEKARFVDAVNAQIQMEKEKIAAIEVGER